MATTIRNRLVVLGTGGTIAGRASQASDNVGYRAGQVGVAQLLQGVPAVDAYADRLEMEQVAQVDSKDMDTTVWQHLLARCIHHLRREQVRGLVVTHGTDTMEETAFFLHRALEGLGLLKKAVVLTGAMRPASSAAPDGPQNLADALATADTPGCAGVVVVFAGVVHHALRVQKQFTYRVDAFGSGEGGPLGVVEEAAVRWFAESPPQPSRGSTAPPQSDPDGAFETRLLQRMQSHPWPRVEIVLSYAGVSAANIDALLSVEAAADGTEVLRGLVIAGTGNGTVHQHLEAAARRAQARGVVVWRASRCPWGTVVSGTNPGALPDAGSLSPVKARIALQLQLLEEDLRRQA